MSAEVIGGGTKKVLYTLNTVRQIGVAKASKALTSKNSCKACGLGMGGQLGGMTNELGEFPSVCNKSIQAQSTDIQPEIPREIFSHGLSDLHELGSRELESLGRLGFPIFKTAGDTHYKEIDWDAALDLAAARLLATEPERTFFYSSGRSSNEAGFLYHLLARVYGTNNVSNCSFYCHQASNVALGETIGTGTSTIELSDIADADLIFVIGANPASNHPRFIHLLKACRDRGGQVVMINPAREPGLVKFAIPKSPRSMLAGGSDIASAYLQPRIGTDIATLKAIAKAVLDMGVEDTAFIDAYTSGAGEFIADIEATSWDELLGATGLTRNDIDEIARLYGQSRAAIFAWGMGVTHHVHGVENVEYIANLALLRGMIGRPGAGLLPLRGHSNVQGIGTIGVKPVLAEDVIEKMETVFGIDLPKTRGMDTMTSMKAADAGRIDAAIFMGGNLFAANPNSKWSERALDKIGFKLFLTTTLNRGHITGVDAGDSLILPVTTRDEEWEPTTQESMFNFVRLSDGGIDRLANVRPESVILADLATRLAPNCPIDFQAFKQHQYVRQAIARIVPGLEELADIDVAKKEFHVRNRLIREPVFRTPSGKARFQTRPLPAHNANGDEAAPFTLSTMRSEGQFNSIIYEEKDAYRGTKTRWSALLNRDDIAALGLVEGDKVTLRSAQGAMKGVAVHGFDLPRGNVLAYYPEANVLTGTAVDPRSKTPGFKSTPIWIESDKS